ncbi:MAG: cyclase family protein [Bacteroidota bacterium]
MSIPIDLTLPYDSDMPGVTIEIAKTLERDGWNARTLHLYSHVGTHMDAPLHFGVTDQSIDQIPLTDCMGPAWVVHLPNLPDQYLIEVKDLGDVAEKVEAGASLLFHTGWSQYLRQSRYRDGLPRISEELAEWCVSKKIKMLGVEPPSIADVNNLAEVTHIHQILLSGGVVIIEGLTNLDKIQQEKVQLIALPLKIQGGDGSPARVIALEG